MKILRKDVDKNYKIENIATFSGVQVIQPPTQLYISVDDTIKVYINGVKYSQSFYTLDYLTTPNTIKITFNEGLLGFPIETTDEIHIAGKFLLL